MMEAYLYAPFANREMEGCQIPIWSEKRCKEGKKDRRTLVSLREKYRVVEQTGY